jgi:tellurite resistance protein/pimeloyl-ACP methyl ester carboxylesterase
MTPTDMYQNDLNWINPAFGQAYDYWVDRSQRSILFWDILRKRGNAYLKHLKAGQPPVLIFDYEMAMDGRTFDKPVNYSLLRILDRRGHKQKKESGPLDERRLTHKGKAVDPQGRPCRPIVVIDPRAGHGPGIGGSKLNSQIGEALVYGHPVYFIMFYTNPEPGQTIGRIQQAEIRFLEEVARRHPDAPKPAVIGNCQAGWATALIGADRPDVTGPMVLNGSPLSYWGGVEGANPMRYKGGLLGGAWLTSLWCDLGCGWFDGAHLVAGFEDLNPANTYWTKPYHLFANVDTEENRFIEFEKWWGGFFKMTAEEIHFIIDSLFIGNELEQGHLRLGDDRVVNLKNFKDPILVFASGGDNITPPQQALNWIYKVYGTVDEIKRCGQVIIYMVHEKIGHLGIFVSGKVAQKEHRHILGSIGWLEYLAPGLYEMVIEKGSAESDKDDYDVRFEAREMEDILSLDDGLEDEEAFLPVNSISRFNNFMYRHYMSPWVKLMVIPPMDSWIRLLHPLRLQRSMISDQNPFCWPVKWTAESVTSQRRPVSADNGYVAWENAFSETMKIGLNYYRDMRDLSQEHLFKSIYGNPWIKMVFGSYGKYADAMLAKEKEKSLTTKERKPIKKSQSNADEGGFVQACVRTMIAVSQVDQQVSAREFEHAEKIVQSDRTLRSVPPAVYKKLVKEQAALLEADPGRALAGLIKMVPKTKERRQVFAIAQAVAKADGKKPGKRVKAVLAEIKKALALDG